MKYVKALTLNEAKKFKPGDKWSNDFDYDGMLKYALKVNHKTPLKDLQKLHDSATDVNYHTAFANLGNAIDWIADDGVKSPKAKDLMKQFHKDVNVEIKSNESVTEGRHPFPSPSAECSKCKGEGCNHCDHKGFHPDPLHEGPNYDDANFNLDKIFGDDQESIEIFQDIEDNGTVKDMIHYIDEFGDEDMLQRYGIRSTAHVKKLAQKIMEGSKVNEDAIITEQKLSRKQVGALDNMNDWLPEDGLERYLEILNQERVPAMVTFLKKNADMKALKRYGLKDNDLETLANVLMNESTYIVESNSIINESVIGIKTERDFKAKTLIAALDKAKIKYKINRLSMTLSVLDLDKKYFDDAKKVVDDLGLSVMMAKESVNEKVSDEEVFSYLNDLRDSGKTNMFGAAAYIEKDFGLDKRKAKEILVKWMKSFNEGKVTEGSTINSLNESLAKNVLKDAKDYLTKTFNKLNKSYVKDYLKTIERMARKSPSQFVKDYGDFTASDWIEDVEYNMANESESKVNEGLNKNVIKKSIKVIDKQIETETGGDGEPLDNETLQALEQERERLEGMLESHEYHPAELENARMMRSSAAEFTRYLTRKAEESKPQNFTEVTEAAKPKKVNNQMWDKMADDERENALLSVIKDPDDTVKWIESDWKDLEGWMQRDMLIWESKVTQRDVSTAFDTAAKISMEMLANLEKYKIAKGKGDEQGIAKHKAIAAQLSQKKRDAESKMNDLIQQLDADVSLEIIEEDRLNEEYVEVMNMPVIANALGQIEQQWSDWKNGPLTEKGDIKPAQKELKGWLDRWFKQNIK
jgi:hypothetical protein